MVHVGLLEVEGFRAVDSLEVDLGGGVMLIGPNGAGKSSIVDALASILSLVSPPRIRRLTVKPSGMIGVGRGEARVALYLDGKRLELKVRPEGVDVLVEGKPVVERRLESVNLWEENPQVARELLGREDAVYIQRIAPTYYEYFDVRDGKTLLAERELRFPRFHSPEVFEAVMGALDRVGLGVAVIFYSEDVVKVRLAGRYDESGNYVGGGWVNFDDLAAGVRKALTYVAALESAAFVKGQFGSDVVVAVEGFEGFLHYDLAVDLIKYMNSVVKRGIHLVVETHLFLHALAALERGWKVYYIEDGRVKKRVERLEDLRELALHNREALAYHYAKH